MTRDRDGIAKDRDLIRAPIALFAFDRPDLLRRTLRSLSECSGFEESTVFFFSDAARDGDAERAARVEAVRAILREEAKRPGASLFEAASNKGLRTSVTEGVSHVLSTYDRVIVLEDDLILSPHFLTFMNRALDFFEPREDVMQVSGYFVPHSDSLPEVGLLRTPASWGWGTWARAWRHYRDDAARLLVEILDADPDGFDLDGVTANVESLRRNASGELDNWGVRWYASVFLRNGLTAYPAMSYVRNIGFAAGGTNTGPGRTAKRYLNQQLAQRPVSFAADLMKAKESEQFLSALKNHHRWKLHEWTRPTLMERVVARLKLLAGKR